MRIPARAITTLVGLSVICFSPARAQTQVKGPGGPAAIQMDRLMRFVYKPDLPGAAVIVVKDGSVVFRRGYGLANLELKVPVRPEMVFRLCSVTKQFTAAAVMMLVESGKLRLDDDVHKFFPEISTGGKTITVANLLTHTSGLKDPINKIWPERMREDMSPLELIDLFKNDPLEMEPGSKESYSNSNYVLLGAVIEKVSGQKYGEFLANNIFKPLGMVHTSYERNQVVVPGRVTGYVFNGTVYLDAAYLSMSQLFAAGGLISSVDDLALWNAGLDSGRILSSKAARALFTPFRLKSGENGDYGYGWVIGKFLGREVASHAGGIPGFRAYVFRMPTDHVYVALLSNNETLDTQPEYLVHRLAAIAIGKPLPNDQVVKVDERSLDAYAGEYQNAGGESLTIRRDGARLIGQGGNDPQFELFPVGRDAFIVKAFDARVTFIKNEKGIVTGLKIQVGDQNDIYTRKKIREP